MRTHAPKPAGLPGWGPAPAPNPVPGRGTRRPAARRRSLAGALFLLAPCLVLLRPDPVPAAAPAGGTAGARAGARGMTRQVDPVILTGEALGGLAGAEVESLRLYAVRGGLLEPIPHQIDRRDENGDFIFPGQGGGVEPASPARLGPRDELVFMARDLGDRLQGGARRTPWRRENGCRYGLEIRVADPVDGAEGWAYLFSFDLPPARSPVDYVSYDPQEDMLSSPAYHIGFKNPRVRTSLNYTALRDADGNGVDLVDRFKARGEATFLWGALRIARDESDFRSRVLAILDGPVRVVRKSRYSLRLLWNVPTPGAESLTYFYRNYIELPTELDIPFDVGYVVTRISSRVSLDFNRAAAGACFYNPNNPEGVVIDGLMSPSEEAMDLGAFEWLLVESERRAMLFRVMVDPKLPVALSLFYRDDAHQDDPPEEDPGQYGNMGWRVGNLEAVKKGAYWYRTLIYFPDTFRKGEGGRYLDAEDHPLRAETGALPAPPGELRCVRAAP